jgi:hypothetical protein
MAVSARRELDYVASNLMPQTWQPLMVVTQLALVILGWLSVSVEVFIRRDFGERYLTWLRLLLGYMAMDLFTLIPRIIFTFVPFVSINVVPVSSLFFKGFVVLALYHQWRIWRRNRKGIAWHSESFGISRLAFLPVSDWILYRFVEPLLCLVIGLFLRYLDPATGIWLIIASIALFVKNQMVFSAQRGRFLDVIDARIESAAMQGVLQGSSKKDSAGYSVMPVPAADFFSVDAPDIAATVDATLSTVSDIEEEPEPGADTLPLLSTEALALTVQSVLNGESEDSDLSAEMALPDSFPEELPETQVSTENRDAQAPPLPKPEALEETLRLLRIHPTATLKEIGGQIGRKESTVSEYLKELQQAGRLQRGTQGFEVFDFSPSA